MATLAMSRSALPEPPIFAVVGPSGAGKDSIIARACAADPRLYWVRRVITRPERKGDEPFEGVTFSEFTDRQAEFALAWNAHGLSYGLPAQPIADARAEGRTVIFNGSRQALPDAARVFPGLRVIVITATPDIRARRLAGRNREDAADVSARLSRASIDIPNDLPRITINNNGSLSEAVRAFLESVRSS